MKSSLYALLPLFAAFGLAAFASAQEPVPLEEAQKIARKLLETLGSPSDAPFTIEADAQKPQGIKAGDVGLIVIPDRKLTAESLGSASGPVTPLGLLWTRGITVAEHGSAPGRARLRLLTIATEGQSAEVQVFYLGAIKKDGGAMELAVFAKDKALPLVTAPLVKATKSAGSFPIELSGRKQEDSGLLTLHFTGDYDAELTLLKASE